MKTTLQSLTDFLRFSVRLIGVIGAVAGVTVIDLRLLHVNSATAAFSFLLLILGLATRLGLKESIIASLASMLAYNFFFLPPIGTFTVADPQNWVALFVFLATAITASQLSSSARRRAEEAAFREQEVQRMYGFSRALLLRDYERTLSDEITQKVSQLLDVQDVSLYDREADSIFKAGPDEDSIGCTVKRIAHLLFTYLPVTLMQDVHSPEVIDTQLDGQKIKPRKRRRRSCAPLNSRVRLSSWSDWNW